MKTKVVLIVMAVSASLCCMAQSDEEKKALKMMDSMMGTLPDDQKAFMQQIMQMGEEAEVKRKKDKEQENSAREKQAKIDAKKGEMEFYWRNKIASTTQGKFENWTHGTADIKVRFYDYKTKSETYLNMGAISSNGQISLQFPSLDYSKWQTVPITKPFGEGDLMISSSLDLDFSNKDVRYFSTQHNLGVYKGDTYLGFLHLGNTIKPVVNLNSPCCFYKAGDGYAAHWVFMSEANSISGTHGGATNIVHDLQFRKGWNLIMIQVEGITKEDSSWKNKYYKATTKLPADAKYYFHSNQ